MLFRSQVRAAVLSNPEKYAVEFADCFDQELKSPRHYSALSNDFRSISFSGMSLSFDREQVLQTVPKAMLARYEQDGAVFMGRAADGFLLMDRFNRIHHVSNQSGMKDFGTITSLFGINAKNMPVEYVTVGVFGKDVPIAVVLGISMGLDNL